MAASEISSWVVAAEEQERKLITLSSEVVDAVKSDEEPEEVITPAERSLIQKILRTQLVQTTEQLEIVKKDPTSPFFSASSFEELNLRPELLRGVYAMGFNSPSRIQEVALPLLLSEPPQNLIAQSQSGTGKTAAFVLTVLSRVKPTENYPQALCIAPTYELALQTGQVLKDMGRFCPDVTVVYAIREADVQYGEPLKQHVVIGTPGTVCDWAFRSKTFDLSKINVFVSDEADVMIIAQGFHDKCIRIQRKLSKECQRMLFSATYDADVMEFAGKMIPDPTIIKLEKAQENLDNIKQYYIRCKNEDGKYLAIANIYASITVGGAMIFCQTKRAAAWLATKLTQDGHSVALLTGDLEISQRIDVLNRFRQSREKILITTNVMARGIDVEQVNLVVNYDLPLDCNFSPDCETYLHRIGRTGRFGKSGIAINLTDGIRSENTLKIIQNHFNITIKLLDAQNIEELEELENA